jgi:hypothetical protein
VTLAVAVEAAAAASDDAQQVQLVYDASDCDSLNCSSCCAYSAAHSKHNGILNKCAALVMQALMASTVLLTV